MDHVPFENRKPLSNCRIHTHSGGYQQLGVPVSPSRTKIYNARINGGVQWQKNFLTTLKIAYADADYLSVYYEPLRQFLYSPCALLETLNMNLILWISGLLKIEPNYIFSRRFYTAYPKKKVISSLCNKFNGNKYQPTFTLADNNQEKNLSALDYLLRLGADKLANLLQ